MKFVHLRNLAFLILLFVAMPSAFSAPPQQQATGLFIFSPQYEQLKVNSGYSLHTHVLDVSTGLYVTNATTNCIFHLYNTTGSHKLQRNMSMDSNGIDFKVDIPASNFTQVEKNAYIIQCQTATKGGAVSGVFEITRTGHDDKGFEITNFSMIALALVLAFLLLYLSNSLAPEHVFLKMILLFFSFAMLFIVGDSVIKLYENQILESTSIMMYRTITWLYRLFTTYVVFYAMYASAKWLGWLDGLKGWFVRK